MFGKFQQKHRGGLLTLLFTDIVGSTQLKQKFGDVEAARLIERHHELLRELLRKASDAQEIETAGDSFLIVFGRPSDAVRFVLAAQRQVRALATETGKPVMDRMGLHLGEVFLSEEPGISKLFGMPIDIASRVMSLAQGTQILMTRPVFDNARQMLRGGALDGFSGEGLANDYEVLQWLNHGPYLLKGIDGPVEICEVGESGKAPLAAPPSTEKAHRFISPESEPVLGWRPAVGQKVPGTQWFLKELVGVGGFGEVWLAQHERLKDYRVFKFCFRADQVRSLKREVTLFRVLKGHVGEHPHIVRLYDVYLDDPPFYLEEEYVAGRDLAIWAQAQGGIGQIRLEIRLELVAQVAEGLQAAHEAGVIHRDIKPGNILIADCQFAISDFSESNPKSKIQNLKLVAKLSDFGIGQVVSEEILADLTRAGFTKTVSSESSSHTGTHLYMAPELLAGKPASTRSDIYSLGVVLYQLITADLTRPVTTDWANHVSDPLLREDLQRCFAGEPDARFGSAIELAQHLRSLPQRRKAQAEHRAEVEQRERAAYRRGIARTASIAAAIAIAIGLLAAYAFRQARRADHQAGMAQLNAQGASNALARAQAAALELEQNLYISDMNLAVQAVENSNLDRARELLNTHRQHRPDFRGFEWRYLWAQARASETRVLDAHAGRARAVAFSPNGHVLASHGIDLVLNLWDMPSSEKRLSISNVLRFGGFVSGGKQILIAGASEQIIRTIPTGNPMSVLAESVAFLEVDSGEITFDRRFGEPIAFVFAAGPFAVTRGSNDSFGLWDIASGQEKLRFAVPRSFWSSTFRRTIAVSADGEKLAVCQSSGIALWNLRNGQTITNLPYAGISTSVAFSPEGKTLVAGGLDGTLMFWELDSLGQPRTIATHEGTVEQVAFSSDGRLMASSSADQTVAVWDTVARQVVRTLGGSGGVVGDVVFNPNNDLLASAHLDGRVRLWEIKPPQRRERAFASAALWAGLAFTPDSKQLAVGCVDSTVKWFDRDTLMPVTVLTNVNLILDIARSGDTIMADQRIPYFWDHAKQLLRPLPVQPYQRAVAISADGKTVAWPSDSTTIELWDAVNWETKGKLVDHERPWISELLFSPDDSALFGITRSDTVRRWDIAGKNAAVLASDLKSAHDLTLSPDGKWLAVAMDETLIQVWNLARASQPRVFKGHRQFVQSIAFSPDSKALASCSNDGTVRLWHLSLGRETAVLRFFDAGSRGVNRRVFDVAFSPDGNALAACAGNGDLRVWHAAEWADTELASPKASGSTLKFKY